MATITLNALGLRCPQPVLQIAAKSAELKKGDVLKVEADCPTFEKDVRQKGVIQSGNVPGDFSPVIARFEVKKEGNLAEEQVRVHQGHRSDALILSQADGQIDGNRGCAHTSL